MRNESSTRRTYGTGTATEVSPGRSRVFFRQNGKRRSFYCATDEVETKLLELQLAAKKDKPLPVPRDKRVGAYALEWLEDRKDHLRPKTLKGYTANVNHHVIPSLGKMRLADLRADDVRRLHRESKARGLAPRSVRYVHLVLKLILDQAKLDELVEDNYAAMVRPPAAPKTKIQPWTKEEALEFLAEVRGDVHETLYVTTLGLGLRRGEVLGLRWSDVNFAARTVTIDEQLQRIKGKGLIDTLVKTDASVATIDVPDFVMDALVVQKDRQSFLGHYSDDGYVFTSTTGTPLEPDNITHRFPEFLRQHGMRHQRFHDLRHSAASLLLAKGVPLWEVSKILRHAGIAITSDTYGYLHKATSRAAADLMDEILSGR